MFSYTVYANNMSMIRFLLYAWVYGLIYPYKGSLLCLSFTLLVVYRSPCYSYMIMIYSVYRLSFITY